MFYASPEIQAQRHLEEKLKDITQKTVNLQFYISERKDISLGSTEKLQHCLSLVSAPSRNRTLYWIMPYFIGAVVFGLILFLPLPT